MKDLENNDQANKGMKNKLLLFLPFLSVPKEIQRDLNGPLNWRDRRKALAVWWLRNLQVFNGGWIRGLGLMAMLLLAILRLNHEDPKANLQQSRAKLLNLIPPEIPDPQNAAFYYGQAIASRVPFSGTPEEDPLARENLFRFDREYFLSPAVTTFLQTQQTILASFKQGSKLQSCNFRIKYFEGVSSLISHLAGMNHGLKLLVLWARHQAALGNHKEAAATLRAGFEMASHIRTDPLWITDMASTAMEVYLQKGVESIVWSSPPPTVHEIDAYRKTIPTWDLRERYVHAWKGERAWGTVRTDQSFPDTFLLPNTCQVGELFWFIVHQGGLRPIINFFYGNERKGYLWGIDRLSEPWSLDPTRDQSFGTRSFCDHGLDKVGMDLWMKLSSNYDSLRVTSIALAWMIFQIRQGQYPKGMNDLVPDYFSQVPLDARGNHEPRFRKDPSWEEYTGPQNRPLLSKRGPTIRIYTLGKNGRDDGGKNYWSREKGVPESSDDPSFRIPWIPQDSEPGGG